jgi:hypothetical protein
MSSPPGWFSVPAYLSVIVVTIAGKIDDLPSRPRLHLRPPWPCQALTDRREIDIIGIKDFSVLSAAETCTSEKSGGLKAVVRDGWQGGMVRLLLNARGCHRNQVFYREPCHSPQLQAAK